MIGSTTFAQEITLQKTAVPTAGYCNRFDISLTVQGTAPDLPQEVILIIDNSGSMGLDIPGDPNEPIDYAKNAALDFVTEFFNNNPTNQNRMAVVTYNSIADINPSGLVGVDGINELNTFISDMVAFGGTNIARGMQLARLEMEDRGTFDCPTQRSYILLSDGVANRDLNGFPCINQPPPGTVTVCMQQAIDEAIAAWVYDPPGPPVEQFEQSIFTVGLLGAIGNSDSELAAEFTLENMQNAGYFPAQSAIDLGPIYEDILGQIGFSFEDALVSDQLPLGYTVVDVQQPTQGIVNGLGTDLLTWDIGSIQNEILVLEYTIEADNQLACGEQQMGNTGITYRNSNCDLVTDLFPESPVCVPCPVLENAFVEQLDCSNIIIYDAEFNSGSCIPFELEFTWSFVLNGVEIGSVIIGPTAVPDPEIGGQFTYDGNQGPLIGELEALLTFDGAYNGGNCQLNTLAIQSVITVDEPPLAPSSGGDQEECFDITNPQVLTATAFAGIGEIILWYDAPDGGNVVSMPILDSVGSVTYYAEAVSNDNNIFCSSISRTPVTLSLFDCAIAIEKSANPNNPTSCTPLFTGDEITYTFSVNNQGNVGISSVVVTDPLIDDTNPIPGPQSGDNNNNGILEDNEVWVYSATYVVTEVDFTEGQIDNTAMVDGTVSLSGLSYAVSSLDSESVFICRDASIALIKTGQFIDSNGDGCATVGEPIIYSFEVFNTGNTILSNITVVDPLVDVIGGPVTLGPGESDSTSFTAEYFITQSDIDAGEVINQAIVEGVASDGTVVDDLSDDNSVEEDDPTIVELCQNAAITLEKTGVWNDENGDGSAQAGETISYAFVVTNIGSITLFDIVIEDPLPGIVIDGGPIEVLEPGEVDDSTFSATYTLTQTDIDEGEVINQAIVLAVISTGLLISDLSDDPLDPTNIDLEEDAEPDDPTFIILPVILPAAFEIFNGITPDGDGRNDFFFIQGIQDFPGNNLQIFNRWGVQVWSTNNYGGSDGTQNVFTGESAGRATIMPGEMLPAGTYYYILNFTGSTNPGKSSYTGYLYINR